jgi:hypothetical protein
MDTLDSLNLTKNNFSFIDIFAGLLNQSQPQTDSTSLAKKFSIITTLIIVQIGLVGNTLTIFVYSNKNHLKNSSHVYMLYLSFIDSLFLIVHIFEDIIRSSISIISKDYVKFLRILDFFNITDKNDTTCNLVMYSRNVARFISAYIIVICMY